VSDKEAVTMPESTPDNSLLDRWRAGDQSAARELFDRYVDRLLGLARQRISQRLGRRVDPEDVVQSVFRTFFKRAKAGQFHIEDPDDLCKLLTRITVHKTLRLIAFHKAAKRDLDQENRQDPDFQEWPKILLNPEPTPEQANLFLDQLEHFLGRLREEESRIIEMRLEGYSDMEIAAQLGISDRKIRRLMERVRGLAQKDHLFM
jgi:RNA polymerase sigma-70 factor (ECF subfamily)